MVVKLWQDWDFNRFLIGGFNVVDVEQIGSFSIMVKFCMDPGVLSPEPVGLGRGVEKGVNERKLEMPSSTEDDLKMT